VKCGNCSDIFDASQHLIEIDIAPGIADNPSHLDTPPGELSNDPSEITQEEANVVHHDPESLSLDLSQEAMAEPVSARESSAISPDQPALRIPDEVETAVIESTAGAIDPTSVNEADMDTSRDAMPELDFPEAAVAPETDVLSEPQRVRWDDALPPYQAPTLPLPNELTTEPPVTFLHGQPPLTIWYRPLVRGALTLMAAVLLTALAGQWVYRERDKLVASHPELKPAFQTACAWLACVVQPVRQIEAFAIDSVAFNKLDKDTYGLSFLVKNTSELPVAYPAIELVLTDAEDQPAYRRVFSSAELGFKAAELSAGTEWPVTVAVRIDAPPAAQRVFGYRLLVFYP
jgi:hypothetical protein